MKRSFLLALAYFLLTSSLATLALASGSSGSSGAPSGAGAVDPYQVTEMMKCVVTEIKPDGTILVRDRETRTTHSLVLTPETLLRARDPSAFGGRKELTARDLKVGQRLKVVTRQVNGEVLGVKVLKS